MPASNAKSGKGVIYQIDDGTSGTVFDSMGEVFDLTLPNQQTDEIEVTHYTSDGDFREFIAGLKDGQEAGFSINWIPGNATDVILRGLHASGATRTHKAVFPSGAEISWLAWVKGFERAAPMDDRMTATITVRVTGPTAFVDPT